MVLSSLVLPNDGGPNGEQSTETNCVTMRHLGVDDADECDSLLMVLQGRRGFPCKMHKPASNYRAATY